MAPLTADTIAKHNSRQQRLRFSDTVTPLAPTEDRTSTLQIHQFCSAPPLRCSNESPTTSQYTIGDGFGWSHLGRPMGSARDQYIFDSETQPPPVDKGHLYTRAYKFPQHVQLQPVVQVPDASEDSEDEDVENMQNFAPIQGDLVLNANPE
ncbi:unnamed protein product, partial [Sphacelaria rigidula]